MLNRNKLGTGHGNRWTRERVTSLRSHHKIPVYRPAEDGVEAWLNLTKAPPISASAPKRFGLQPKAPTIEALHPLPDGPWIFSRATLDGYGRARSASASSTRQTPHGTAPQSGKSLRFSNIGRWVL